MEMTVGIGWRVKNVAKTFFLPYKSRTQTGPDKEKKPEEGGAAISGPYHK